MSYVFPGSSNVYAPSLEATGHLMVNFVRNPKTFKYAEYCTIKKVDKEVGLYAASKNEEAARVINSDGRDLVWADGNDRPRGFANTEAFSMLQYQTKRYDNEVTLGWKTVQQASWEILAQ